MPTKSESAGSHTIEIEQLLPRNIQFVTNFAGAEYHDKDGKLGTLGIATESIQDRTRLLVSDITVEIVDDGATRIIPLKKVDNGFVVPVGETQIELAQALSLLQDITMRESIIDHVRNVREGRIMNQSGLDLDELLKESLFDTQEQKEEAFLAAVKHLSAFPDDREAIAKAADELIPHMTAEQQTTLVSSLPTDDLLEFLFLLNQASLHTLIQIPQGREVLLLNAKSIFSADVDTFDASSEKVDLLKVSLDKLAIGFDEVLLDGLSAILEGFISILRGIKSEGTGIRNADLLEQVISVLELIEARLEEISKNNPADKCATLEKHLNACLAVAMVAFDNCIGEDNAEDFASSLDELEDEEMLDEEEGTRNSQQESRK